MPFISKTLPYFFCACVRNTPKIVTFVIGVNAMVYHRLKSSHVCYTYSVTFVDGDN